MCSVFSLAAQCSSLTVNLVVTLRKFISLLLSVIYFDNDFTAFHWLGTMLVFTGTLLFTDVLSSGYSSQPSDEVGSARAVIDQAHRDRSSSVLDKQITSKQATPTDVCRQRFIDDGVTDVNRYSYHVYSAPHGVSDSMVSPQLAAVNDSEPGDFPEKTAQRLTDDAVGGTILTSDGFSYTLSDNSVCDEHFKSS